MALKKPSQYFNKISINDSIEELEKVPDLNTFSDAFESFKNNLSKIEVISEFSDTLDNYRVNIERVNYLSEKIEDLQTEVQKFLKKDDLDRAMMAQLLVVEQSILDVQNKVKGINEKNLQEIRLDVAGLTESINEFLNIEVPKYKKLVVDSEIRTNNRYEELEENVNKTLEGIGEFVDNRYEKLTKELQGINEQSVSSIIAEFQILDQTVLQLKEEEIPKYKNFIVETERKTEVKLDEFNEKINETVDSLLQKISVVEGDKTNLIKIVNDKIQEVLSLRDLVLDDLEENEESRKNILKKVNDLEVEVIRNESHLKVQNKNLQQIQEDVRSAIRKLNIEELEEKNHTLSKKIKYLEEVFEKFNEKEILAENIIVEPPSTDNKDPLTPTNQNFVTLEQLQQHYRLFVNRIQQQLATIGGGGETRFEFLDDVDRQSVKQDKFVIQYDATVGKFIGTSYIPGDGSGGVSVIPISNNPPSNPQAGNLWYDNEVGRTFIYYEDINGSQWVDASPSGVFPIENNWNYGTNITTTLTNVGIGTTVLSYPTNKVEIIDGDLSVGINTSTGIILTSSNGSRFRIIVNNDGSLLTTAV